jgi:nitroreductase
MKSLLERRSIRKYTNEKINAEIIKDLLRAAMSAPSAANQKPCYFIAIDDRATLDAMADFHPYAGMLKNAPLAIVVCATNELGTFKDYWVQDCAAASENILTAVQEKGLGATWIGVYPHENHVVPTKKLFNLPENITPFSFISIGHPDEIKEIVDRYEEKRVHYNTW